MINLPPSLLFLTALPAVVLSVWLMHIANVPRSILIQQVVVAAFMFTLFYSQLRLRRRHLAVGIKWFPLFLSLSLFIPLVMATGSSPKRWLVLGSSRLYIASVVLPAALYLLGKPSRSHVINAASVTAAVLALMLHPDAAQLSAFSLAMFLILAVSNWPRPICLAFAAGLLLCNVFAWRFPDSLAPVPYVEGVFHLAASASPLLLLAALFSAAMLVIGLAWIGLTLRSGGPLAVALYYACLFAIAPLQVTPVPLLGFGAGPIIGYFLVTSLIWLNRGDSDPDRRSTFPGFMSAF